MYDESVLDWSSLCEMSVLYLCRLPSPVGHQDVMAAVNPHEDPLVCKVSPSKNYGAKKQNQNVDLYSGGNVSSTTISQLFPMDLVTFIALIEVLS
jgi:hypothetical protein